MKNFSESMKRAGILFVRPDSGTRSAFQEQADRPSPALRRSIDKAYKAFWASYQKELKAAGE